MRVDVHAHYWTEEYLDLLEDLGKADAGAARGIGTGDGAELDARLRLMDRAEVQTGFAPSPRCRCRTWMSPSAKCAGLLTSCAWPGWR